MSTTLSDNTITVREFSIGYVNFIANNDLGHELRHGGNNEAGSSAESDHVLVTINVDGCEYTNVQVSAHHSQNYLAAIEASIEAQIVVRDQLRKMTVAA